MAINLTNIENEYNRIQTAKSDIATSMNNAGSDVSATNTMDEIALAVSNTTTELRAVAGQLTPNFANNIDELTGGGIRRSCMYCLMDLFMHLCMKKKQVQHLTSPTKFLYQKTQMVMYIIASAIRMIHA